VLGVDLRRVRGRYVGPPLPRYPDGSWEDVYTDDHGSQKALLMSPESFLYCKTIPPQKARVAHAPGTGYNGACLAERLARTRGRQ
jgi:hypothetical protein